MTNLPRTILAIESAICGGSISLIENGVEIRNWIGSSSVSKAEDLLVNIDAILTSTGVSRHDIDMVAVSAGPGSFTGIRIGLATALGFQDGLGIAMSSESALRAMAFQRPENITAALPVGRGSVCVQSFRSVDAQPVAVDHPQAMPDETFFDLVHNARDTNFILHESLYLRVAQMSVVTNFGSNLAFAIGTICASRPGQMTEPLFISKSV